MRAQAGVAVGLVGEHDQQRHAVLVWVLLEQVQRLEPDAIALGLQSPALSCRQSGLFAGAMYLPVGTPSAVL